MNEHRDLLEAARRACTPRQLEVLQLVNDGHSTRSIARQLHISRQAVADHITAAKRRIDKETNTA